MGQASEISGEIRCVDRIMRESVIARDRRQDPGRGFSGEGARSPASCPRFERRFHGNSSRPERLYPLKWGYAAGLDV